MTKRLFANVGSRTRPQEPMYLSPHWTRIVSKKWLQDDRKGIKRRNYRAGIGPTTQPGRRQVRFEAKR